MAAGHFSAAPSAWRVAAAASGPLLILVDTERTSPPPSRPPGPPLPTARPLAPQPLLVLLGVLLGDITDADVYQRRTQGLQLFDRVSPRNVRQVQ